MLSHLSDLLLAGEDTAFRDAIQDGFRERVRLEELKGETALEAALAIRLAEIYSDDRFEGAYSTSAPDWVHSVTPYEEPLVLIPDELRGLKKNAVFEQYGIEVLDGFMSFDGRGSYSGGKTLKNFLSQ